MHELQWGRFWFAEQVSWLPLHRQLLFFVQVAPNLCAECESHKSAAILYQRSQVLMAINSQEL